MDSLATGEPVWELHFDEHGGLTAPAEADFLDEVTDQAVTDLFVFSHGWGTSVGSARGLYQDMFPRLRDAAAGLAGAKIGFVGIYWPSLWFPPTPATPPPVVSSTQAGNSAVADLSAGTAHLTGAEIAAALSPGFTDPAEQDAIEEIGRLIDDGLAAADADASDTAQQQRIERIHDLVTSLVPPAPDGEVEDSGETGLLLANPETSFQAAAVVFGSAPAGSSTQSLGDRFKKAFNGAKDATRVLSYTVMKARAGDIGRTGLGPLLARLHTRSAAVRVHLIGHSFGARLVSFALAGVGEAADSPIASLVLLQGAFSHWAFAHAQDNPFGEAGALNAFRDRVHGPLVATFSSYDWAVGIWYPRASLLTLESTSATEKINRWGGMGADGFQAVSPAADLTMPADDAADYGLAPGTFYRVNAGAVINDVSQDRFSGAHSDIRKPQVAQLAAAAAAS
jgi:hypothetical protein